MAGVSGVSGVSGLSRAQFEAEFQVRALKMQQDAMEQQGESAVQLIETAMAATEGVGGKVNIAI